MNSNLLCLPKCLIVYLTTFLNLLDKAHLKQICKRYNECIIFSSFEIIHKYETYINSLKSINYKKCIQCGQRRCVDCLKKKFRIVSETCGSCDKLICSKCIAKEYYNECDGCSCLFCFYCDAFRIKTEEQCKKCNKKYCNECNEFNTIGCSMCSKSCCVCDIITCDNCNKNFCPTHIEKLENNYITCVDCANGKALIRIT